MKAVRMHEYGGPEVIVCEEVPRPEPAADEVLIHVQAADVNIDSGQLSPTIATTMPLEKARQAHEMSQSGHTRGKIILTI